MSSQTQTLTIDGMHCEHCVEAVEDALSGVHGVTVLDVQIGTAEVAYDNDDVTDDEIRVAIDRAGYTVEA